MIARVAGVREDGRCACGQPGDGGHIAVNRHCGHGGERTLQQLPQAVPVMHMPQLMRKYGGDFIHAGHGRDQLVGDHHHATRKCQRVGFDPVTFAKLEADLFRQSGLHSQR